MVLRAAVAYTMVQRRGPERKVTQLADNGLELTSDQLVQIETPAIARVQLHHQLHISLHQHSHLPAMARITVPSERSHLQARRLQAHIRRHCEGCASERKSRPGDQLHRTFCFDDRGRGG
jgi:hypothetical protein